MAKIILNCNRIQFIPFNQVDSISGTTITPKSGFSMNKLKTIKVEITEDQKHTAAGDLISQSLKAKYIQSTQVLNKLLRLPQIVKITRSDGTELLFGSLTNPALALAKGVSVNSGEISFKRDALQFEFVSAATDQFS